MKKRTNPKFINIFKKAKNDSLLEDNKPFKISIMGQTGVGKSSLLNALFNIKLQTDNIKPCTKEIEIHKIKNVENAEIWFYDLPGIGESVEADDKYLLMYLEKIKECDIVLWALNSGNRSITFDLIAIKKLISLIKNKKEQVEIFNKILIVLTKVDQIIPPPWIISKKKEECDFSPDLEALNIIENKKKYYYSELRKPFNELLKTKTHNIEKISSKEINDERFIIDRYSIEFIGEFTFETLNQLSKKYPEKSSIFERLYENNQIVATSAYYKYNLIELLSNILSKLDSSAIGRFDKLIPDNLENIPFDKAKTFSNLIVIDEIEEKILFNLNQ